MPEVKWFSHLLVLHLFYQDIKLCADTVNGRKARFLKVAVKLPKEDPSGQLTTMVEMFEQPGLFFCVRNLPLKASSSVYLCPASLRVLKICEALGRPHPRPPRLQAPGWPRI